MTDKHLIENAWSPATVLDALERHPRRLLGSYPTPLIPLQRLSRETGRRILLKRDDILGPGVGGNKTRKLKYLLAAALGYVRAALEIEEQAQQAEVGDACVVLAAGSGGTLAGLLVGLRLIASSLEPVGIDVGGLWHSCRGRRRYSNESIWQLNCLIVY
jgi:1-aminocyclopropane-1-carboxylate deaminase/D-cysteine desulfhydrase-like pyridoxal-dependent ACC family enzyme